MKNIFYWATGLLVLIAVACKHRLFGYTEPAGFKATNWELSDEHGRGILVAWERLSARAGTSVDWTDLDILELGPGGTLSTGALLLARGAKSYCAFDAFPLAKGVGTDFYEYVLRDVNGATRNSVLRAIEGKTERSFEYIVDADFEFDRKLFPRKFDIILSCAAFEHFEDIDSVIGRASRIIKPGGHIIAIVDFQTHSKVLRDRDPNNIYRYSKALYRFLKFPAQPNRARPRDYRRSLEKYGFRDISVVPAKTMSLEQVNLEAPHLAIEFRDREAEMSILSALIIARSTAMN